MFALGCLALAGTEVENLALISHLAIESLDISSTRVSDFSELSEMTNLKGLRFSDLRIRGLNFVKSLNLLSTIYLKDLKGDVPDEVLASLTKND